MGSALEDYGMSWMSSKIGGGGEIVVLTVDHFQFVCPLMEIWLLHLFEKGHQARFWLIALYRHNASGFCDESGRFGMQRIENDGIRG